MNLYCCENSDECRAYRDPVLLDERVLQNLLRTEDKYMPSSSYFMCVQKELTPQMRKIVAEWMLEVCEEQKCQDEVYSLAMNYVDRFLSVCPIRKTQLQLLGTACLLLSSKLRESSPLTAETLVYYTDNSITLQDLWMWELLVLSKLKWDLSAITPQDFLDHILYRLKIDDSCDYVMVRRHAQTFIALCARDYKFALYTPSMIAASSVAAGLHGLRWTKNTGCSLVELLDRLHHITSIETDYLQSCFNQIEEMVSSAIGSRNQSNQANAPQRTEVTSSEKLGDHGKAETPTDVRDIHF